ncbi:MAG: zinc ribbon domain-containing protein, partial [Christensenellaceae bacterium]|jgi:hypothetical protein|nr:zinc ribbon domain-containing protein [Christensenellaceae bacterium]
MATAREPYLLTGKLFCGHCGTGMVADGGTSKTKVQHHYYACKNHKRKGQCTKKNEQKNNLENYVVECVRDWLSDPKNVDIAIKDTLTYYAKRTDSESLKSIAKKIAETQKEVEELATSFVKAKSTLLQETIEKKMTDYETLLDDLYTQRAKIELERGYHIDEDDMREFIADILKGDPKDKEYQRSIIDNLIYRVVVSDDNTYVGIIIDGHKPDNTPEKFDNTELKSIIKNGIRSSNAITSPPPKGIACIMFAKNLFLKSKKVISLAIIYFEMYIR